MLDDVMPRVWAQLPEARLRLVGRDLELPPAQRRARRARRLRRRSSPTPTPTRRCAVVPLLQGGGTPLKFVEALAYGLPVLATPRAAAGLAVTDGEHCVLAEAPTTSPPRSRRFCARARPRSARTGASWRWSATRSRRSTSAARAGRLSAQAAASESGAGSSGSAGGSPAIRASRPIWIAKTIVKRSSAAVNVAVVSATNRPATRRARRARTP